MGLKTQLSAESIPSETKSTVRMAEATLLIRSNVILSPPLQVTLVGQIVSLKWSLIF